MSELGTGTFHVERRTCSKPWSQSSTLEETNMVLNDMGRTRSKLPSSRSAGTSEIQDWRNKQREIIFDILF